MLPFFLMDEGMRNYVTGQAERRRKARIERGLPLCVPWDSITRWQPELNIKAETFRPLNLFPELEPFNGADANVVPEKNRVDSPSGEWRYYVAELAPKSILDTIVGGKKGDVLFDGAVYIPKIHQKRYDEFERDPWMSITPTEILSLRIGTKRARGHVVIAGLGLGHQLISVSARKQVTKLTLVERSQELVDWLLPRIRPHLDARLEKKLKVIVGDAHEVLPKLAADVALVDIFSSYGGNYFPKDCPNIPVVWCWGAPEVRSSGGYW